MIRKVMMIIKVSLNKWKKHAENGVNRIDCWCKIETVVIFLVVVLPQIQDRGFWRQRVWTGLKLGTTIGILCKVRHSPNQEVCTTTIHFSLNGQLLDTLTDSITVKTTEQLWPSLSLSSNVMVLGLFSSSDLRYPPDDAKDVVGLDGVSVWMAR